MALDAELQELIDSAPKAAQPKDLSEEDKAKVEKLKSKIPGLDLTYADAEDLSLAEEDIKALQEVKKKYEVDLHLIRTYRKPYVVRECARIEWRNKMMDWQESMDQAREQMAQQNKDMRTIEQVLNMLMQERVVSWLLVHPVYDPQQLRRLPPGEIETIFNGIMLALGFNQPVVPIKF